MKVTNKLKNIFLIFLFSSSVLNAAVTPGSNPDPQKTVSVKKEINKLLTEELMKQFAKQDLDKKGLAQLRDRAIKSGGESIPALVKVMKSSDYPDKSRWVATFLVGKIMGEKSAPFIAKFAEHPNWVMRMASLKTLQALKQSSKVNLFAKSLSDKSWLVRKQALDSIKHLNIVKAAPQVWSMLYNKENYYINKKGSKRTNLIKDAVKVVGDLKFEKALDPLFAMIQKPKYEDIFEEMEYALTKITNKKSPDGSLKTKRNFWKKTAISYKVI